MSNSVFVLDTLKRPLMPCRPSRARRLLRDGKAAVYRLQPFTLILKYPVKPTPQPVELKADPGSKTTGLALVGEFPKQGRVVLWAGNLHHRGDAIRKRLADRRAQRLGRRSRHTRYRALRFDNRTRPTGWLPPSLKSRVDNVRTWVGRLIARVPVKAVAVETVRFDTQALQTPEISGVQYQHGTLFGYELREYLLEKWGRKCAYCGAKESPLEVEHIVPRSRGGSDRASNLTLVCVPCNQRKGNRTAAEFEHPELQAKAKQPLKDAAAINSIRYAVGNALRAFGLAVSFWTGGRTKFNRASQGYPKDHWIDAACVGTTGEAVSLNAVTALSISATGRGKRQVVKLDRYGFPRGAAGRIKRVLGFQTGDLVRLVQPRGKYAGTWTGRLAGIRADGRLDIQTLSKKVTAPARNYHLLQHGDGYAYA
jgi:5-methylcytosine-specific restriction endonuclease McrA